MLIRRLISLFTHVSSFVTGIQVLVPMFGPGIRIRVYVASLRDRGTGSTKVRAGRSYTMSRELELVAGRLCDSTGCAESANPLLSCRPPLPLFLTGKGDAHATRYRNRYPPHLWGGGDLGVWSVPARRPGRHELGWSKVF